MNPFKMLALAALIAGLLDDIVKATRKDSPGGKKITRREWRKIVEGLREKLLDDDFDKQLEAIGI